MSRALQLLDRTVTLLVGLAVLALGLAVLDWRYEVLRSYPDRVDVARWVSWTGTAWWPWAVGGVGLLLVLLGLAWLLAHVRRPGSSDLRLPGGGPSGALTVDLASAADAVAARLRAGGPFEDVRGRATERDGRSCVELDARLGAYADGAGVRAAAEAARADVEQAFGGTVGLRVLVRGPRSRRRPRSVTGAPRVQ